MTEPKPPVKGELNTDKIMKMVADMETIEAFITNGRFVGDSVHTSIEHLAECIRKNTYIPADDFGRILEAMQGVFDLADCDCPDSPDQESIGWHGDGEIPVTFGQIRAFRDAIALARKYGSAE